MAKSKSLQTKTAPKQLITEDMPIGDIVQKWPETASVFAMHGMHCFGCAIASFESIGEGARAHGVALKKLLGDINKAAKSKRR